MPAGFINQNDDGNLFCRVQSADMTIVTESILLTTK
jgi:hypothetical protein